MRSDLGVDAAVTAALDVPLAGLDDDALLDRVREVERARRVLAAEDHRVICELEVRSVAARRLHRGTAGLLSAVLHLDRSETAARVAAAAELGPRTALNGEPLEPLLAATAAAQARGDVSAAHARVVSRTMRDLPTGLDDDVRAAAEAQLAEQASLLLPAELAQVGERLVAHLDPDGRLTDDADRARRRNFTLGRQGADGMTPVRGLLAPAARALLDAALTTLAKPEPQDGAPDPRSAGQRNHDALAALASQAMAAGTVGAARGTPASVVLTMTLDDLERRAGQATTATGSWLSVTEALDLAADASWALLVLDRRGTPLWLGRSHRLATRPQRQALLVRDGGCTRPGCDVVAARCEAHHLQEWADGGATDLDNLALVCPYDHHLITDQGYTVQLDASGRVTWTAPAWLDPDQQPQVNQVHRPLTPDDGSLDPRHRRRRAPTTAQRRLRTLTARGPSSTRSGLGRRTPVLVGADPP